MEGTGVRCNGWMYSMRGGLAGSRLSPGRWCMERQACEAAWQGRWGGQGVVQWRCWARWCFDTPPNTTHPPFHHGSFHPRCHPPPVCCPLAWLTAWLLPGWGQRNDVTRQGLAAAAAAAAASRRRAAAEATPTRPTRAHDANLVSVTLQFFMDCHPEVD